MNWGIRKVLTEAFAKRKFYALSHFLCSCVTSSARESQVNEFLIIFGMNS